MTNILKTFIKIDKYHIFIELEGAYDSIYNSKKNLFTNKFLKAIEYWCNNVKKVYPNESDDPIVHCGLIGYSKDSKGNIGHKTMIHGSYSHKIEFEYNLFKFKCTILPTETYTIYFKVLNKNDLLQYSGVATRTNDSKIIEAFQK